jgi:hypothetical protein
MNVELASSLKLRWVDYDNFCYTKFSKNQEENNAELEKAHGPTPSRTGSCLCLNFVVLPLVYPSQMHTVCLGSLDTRVLREVETTFFGSLFNYVYSINTARVQHGQLRLRCESDLE